MLGPSVRIDLCGASNDEVRMEEESRPPYARVVSLLMFLPFLGMDQ